MKYRIATITPRGLSPISLSQFTIVVGPNNAGKSQILRDLAFIASGRPERAKVLSDLEINFGVGAVQLLQSLIANLKPNEGGAFYLDSAGISFDENVSMGYEPRHHDRMLASEHDARAHVAQHFARQILAYLTTEARLTFSKKMTQLYRPGHSGVSSLAEALYYQSNAQERWISDRTRRAFDLEIALDNFTNPGALEIRVASDFTGLRRDDRGSARVFMEGCARLDEQGDGLRSFVATLGAARAVTREVFLIDEPEAFLHPPQAFQIGRSLAEGDFGQKQFICATHSADFLRGVLSVRTDITVIRIARSTSGQNITALSPAELARLANDPVLSSGRVLDGIFYRQVVITESDGDSVLYGSLSNQADRAGETYYVNAYSKQATATVSAPYRHMGVPHAAIVDIDLVRVAPEFERVANAFLKDTSDVLNLASQVRACIDATAPEELISNSLQQVENLRAALARERFDGPERELEWLRARLSDIRADANAWSDIKRSGIHSIRLTPGAREALQKLIAACAESGLFLVPVGEREGWLAPALPYTKNKTKFTTDALEYLAAGRLTDEAPLAVFMRDVHTYLSRP